MSKIITVDNLSKTYRIGTRLAHAGSLRDSIGALFRAPFSLNKSNGKQGGKEFWALKDVSFSIEPGEVVGIIGRNGAGKSTLLKILSRITAPSSGRIELHGRVGSLLEVGTGFHPELTGRENIFLNGSILGMKRSEIERDFDEIVAFSEIEKFLDTPVKHYSSGMYVRLAFAVAAHLVPEILIVDEVLAVGDTQFQKKCLGKMGSVAKQGRTVLFVSHSLPAIRNLCERTILLEGGALKDQGKTADIIHRYFVDVEDRSDYDLRTRTDRSGTGEVRCVRITYLDASQKVVPFLYSGQSCYFQVDIEADSAGFNQIKIGIGIDDAESNRIVTLFSEFTDQTFDIKEMHGRFLCAVPALNLRPDTYLISVYIGNQSKAYDCVIHAAKLEVHDSDFFGTGRFPDKGQGPVLMKQHWSMISTHTSGAV
jgi:lipopolysaccharide transport system ATP-binding protein